MKEYPYNLNITFNYAKEIGNKMYFSSNMFNGLFVFDKETQKISWLGVFPDENLESINLHQKVFLWNGRLVFSPMKAMNISIYDPKRETFKTISYKKKTSMRGCDAFLIDNSLYIFDCFKVNGIDKINLCTGEISTICVYNNVLHGATDSNIAFNTHWIFKDGMAYGGVYRTNTIFRINLKNAKYETIELSLNIKIRSITFVGDILFVLGIDNILYKYDVMSSAFNAVTKAKAGLYVDMWSTQHKVILLSSNDREINVWDEEHEELYTIIAQENLFADCTDIRKQWRAFLFCERKDNELIIFPYRNSSMLKLTSDNHLLREVPFFFDRCEMDLLWSNFYYSQISEKKIKEKIIEESELFNLEDLISCID